ncbi:MAG TPA: alanyl-tRNA editing protein [Chloroflexia bacterium]|nr:alanyl-tRNA editing protein [Chloroflexia bacterium]
METKLQYLLDSYQREMQATVLEILPEPAKKLRVKLDVSVFCPDGGGGKANRRGGSKGQPGDTGLLLWAGSHGFEPQARINLVTLEQNELWHFLEPLVPDETPLLEVGQAVTGILDWERRYRHMQTHSAAYLLHYTLYENGLIPALIPLRADYGTEPFVIYQTNLQPAELNLKALETRLNELVVENLTLDIEPAGEERLNRSEISFKLAGLEALLLPVASEGSGFGTLVKRSAEVGPVRLLAAEQWSDQQLKISYQLVTFPS